MAIMETEAESQLLKAIIRFYRAEGVLNPEKRIIGY